MTATLACCHLFEIGSSSHVASALTLRSKTRVSAHTPGGRAAGRAYVPLSNGLLHRAQRNTGATSADISSC